MKTRESYRVIRSMKDLKKEEHAVRLRIRAREEELQARINHIPGELFYSGVDNILPNFIKGKVSSFALGAGKGIINSFFISGSPVTSGGLKILQAVKPSGLVKKAQTAITAVFRKKKH